MECNGGFWPVAGIMKKGEAVPFFTMSIPSMKRTPRIGALIIPTDPFWIQTLEAVQHHCHKLGDELVPIQPAVDNPSLYLIPVDALVENILAQDLDVLICTLSVQDVLIELLQSDLPVICLSELEMRHPRLTVMESLYPGGVIAGEYIGRKLNGQGMALCVSAGLERMPVQGQSRAQGFMDGLAQYPQINVHQMEVYWGYDQSYAELIERFRGIPRPYDAIFGVSDALILAARDAGWATGAVDAHTVLVGLNGDPMALAGVAEGTLSATVDTASENLGREAMLLAHDAANGLPLPPSIPFKFDLITAENVAGIATQKLRAIADIPSHMVGVNRASERDRLRQLEASMEITRRIASLQDRDRVVQVVGDLIREFYGYEWMRILRWSEKEGKLALYGGACSPVSDVVAPADDELLQQCYLEQRTFIIPDLHASRRWHPGPAWQQVRARMLLPIRQGERVIGVLDLQSANPQRRPSMEIVGIELLASQLGIVLQNADLYSEALDARASAEKANEIKTRLVANVGHEMRTPLNAILGFSQAILKELQAGQLDAAVLAQDVQNIYKSGEHLMYMINDILDLSRAEIGALSLYFELIQPETLLRELFDGFVRARSAGEVKWDLNLPERLPFIRVDAVRLRQILVNLLVNAAKYTRRGRIELGAAVEPPFLHLWVKDTGPGVPLDLQTRIFEPFGVVGRKRRPEGIGLGLSITRHLVALHNGTITLESIVNVGSTFHIYLPLPGLSETPAPASENTQAAMLVVSSTGSLPDDIRDVCMRSGLAARVATNREEILQVLAEGSPQVVAWDLSHADPGDWALIQMVSTQLSLGALPLLVYGANVHPAGVKDGLTNVLYKPYLNNNLRDWINQFAPLATPEPLVLVVDDDAQARETACSVVGSIWPGCRMVKAENGRVALEALARETPDLVLLDLIMPELDGFGVLEQIRSSVRTQRVPVIILSGKLLTYEDIQRLDHLRTYVMTKGLFSPEEMGQFVERVKGETHALPQPTSLLVKQVLAFLHSNFGQHISRKDIASAVGLSENYLSQIFHQEIGISPWDYLLRYRVQRAQELLAATEQSVTEIATRVGFNDPAYFSRVFRKIAGQSPQEFRRAAADKNPTAAF